MPKGRRVSNDLRETIVHMHFALSMSIDAIHECTPVVSRRNIERILSQFREKMLRQMCTPRRSPRKKQGRPKTVDEATYEALNSLVGQAPDLYLSELKSYLEEVSGSTTSMSTIWRALKESGFTLKQISKQALERNEEARMAFRLHMGSQYQSNQLVFVDESAFDRRSYFRGSAWALRGMRACRKTCFVRGRRYSILPALSLQGMIYCLIVEGSFDSALFMEFIRGLLDQMQPFPAPNSVIVMDNCRIHKSPEIIELIESRGMRVEFLPPYSPDFNPIELAFSVIKARLRRMHDFARVAWTGRDDSDVYELLYSLVNSISASLAKSFFIRSGHL